MRSFFRIANPKNSITMLDGVRAVACFTIIFYHINLVTHDPHIHIWTTDMIGPIAAAIAFAGSCGVTLFFVLSGFLLFLPYARALVYNGEWPDWKRYYLRRIFRIWPGYLVSLFLLILWLHPDYLQPQHRLDLFLFLTFFMDSTSRTYQAINGPFWTLAVEWQFYIILPLLALGFAFLVRRQAPQRRVWVLMLCLAAVVVWGVATRQWGRSWIVNPNQPLWLPSRLHKVLMFFVYGQAGKFLEDFAIGMCLGTWYVLAQEKGNIAAGQRAIAWLRRSSDWLWGIGILWLFFLGIWYIFPPLKAFLQPWIGEHAMFTELSYAVGYGCCLAALLFGTHELRRLFEWRPLCWLGQLTYGLYIWHLPLLLWLVPFMRAVSQGWPPIAAYGLYWAMVVFLIIPGCYLFYLLIERPGISVGNLLVNRLKYQRVNQTDLLVQTRAGQR